MWLQAAGLNTLSGSIIIPSVRPSVHLSICPSFHPSIRLSAVHMSVQSSMGLLSFCICINFQCGDPVLRCIYYVERTLWMCSLFDCFMINRLYTRLYPVTSSWAYISVLPFIYLYLCLFGSLHLFLAIICAPCNFAQCMRMQSTGSDPLSGSIICLSVRLSDRPPVHPSGFLRHYAVVVFVFIYSVWVYPYDTFILALGYERPQWGPVELIYMSVRPSLCISVYLYASLFVDHLRGP